MDYSVTSTLLSRSGRSTRTTRTTQASLASITKVKRRYKVIADHCAGSSSSSENEDEDDKPPIYVRDEQAPKKSVAMEFDLWSTLKAFKSMKVGDQAHTAMCLGIISSQDLTLDFNVEIICQSHNLELLINILDTDDTRCRNGALLILKEVSKRKVVATKVTQMGIGDTLTNLLFAISPSTNALAGETIATIGWRRQSSRALRGAGAIPILVARMKISKAVLMLKEHETSQHEKDMIQVVKWASYALWALASFKKNKLKMMAAGVIPLLINIVVSGNREVLLPILGLLSECAAHPMFQLAIMDQAIVGMLVFGCQTEDLEMQKLCAVALSRAAGGNDIVREMIRFHEGPKVIMELIMDTDASDYRMLTAGISAMWKSAISLANAEEFERLGAVPILVDLLGETEMEVLIATVGAVGEIAKCDKAREDFIRKGALTEIISLLGHINEQLLINSAHAVGICSDCDEGIAMLDKSDGLRLLWSLLKNKSERVKIEALWAVRPCVTRHPDSGELIRSLMDSLNLLVKMLKQENREVLTAVCAVVSQVALDLENLGVMTEQGVVKHLSSLLLREPRDVEIEEAERQEMRSTAGIRFQKLSIRTMLHRELASAVANCSRLDENRRAFGRAGVIPIIVDYMRTKNPELLAQTCRALHALSEDHFNCVSIQSCGAVPFLLVAIESQCMVTQIGAAGTLKNIRLMLHRSEEKRITFDCLPRLERQKKLKEIQAIVDILSGPREPDEDKELILKGHARASFSASKIKRAMAKRKSHGDSLTSVSFMKMQDNINKRRSTVLSWRERKSLLSLMKHETRDRHPSDQSAILHAQVATEKVRKISVDSQTSHGKEK